MTLLLNNFLGELYGTVNALKALATCSHDHIRAAVSCNARTALSDHYVFVVVCSNL